MPEFSVQKVQKHERGGGGEKQNKTKKQTNKKQNKNKGEINKSCPAFQTTQHLSFA